MKLEFDTEDQVLFIFILTGFLTNLTFLAAALSFLKPFEKPSEILKMLGHQKLFDLYKSIPKAFGPPKKYCKTSFWITK